MCFRAPMPWTTVEMPTAMYGATGAGAFPFRDAAIAEAYNPNMRSRSWRE